MLHIKANNKLCNNNDKQYIEELIKLSFEKLRNVAHAPSVQVNEIPNEVIDTEITEARDAN